jgi:NADP-dependent alcohol dehydrogenase
MVVEASKAMIDQVKEALKDRDLHEFGGVPANPEYEV